MSYNEEIDNKISTCSKEHIFDVKHEPPARQNLHDFVTNCWS